MLWNEHYADDRAMVLDLCDIMNAELRELAAVGGIGVVNHCITTVEPADHVAGLIRKALEYIPPSG